MIVLFLVASFKIVCFANENVLESIPNDSSVAQSSSSFTEYKEDMNFCTNPNFSLHRGNINFCTNPKISLDCDTGKYLVTQSQNNTDGTKSKVEESWSSYYVPKIIGIVIVIWFIFMMYPAIFFDM